MSSGPRQLAAPGPSGKIGDWLGAIKQLIRGVELPYDRTNPAIFDKDDYLNGYTGEFLLALASAGEIDLRGIIAGTLWPEADPDEILAGHREYAAKARRSGLRNVPEPVAGAFRALRQPASSNIAETTALDSPGARLIVDEARKASPEKPLVVVAGGSLTTVACAYLIDPSIADRVIVSAALGREQDMGDYNGFVDGWSAYIVLRQLRYVQFPVGIGAPEVPKRRFKRLPDNEFRDWLIDKHAPYSNLPAGTDVDGAPAISLVRSDFAARARRVSFDRWSSKAIRGIPHLAVAHYPTFKPDPQGTALVVTRARSSVATAEFWRAMRNPKIW